MKWVNRLQRKLGRNFGVTNLMMYVSATMLAVYILGEMFPQIYGWIMLYRDAVFAGQVWRLVTFLGIPLDASNPIWSILMLYFMYMLGGNLESAWGKSNMTLYCIFGAVGAILAAMVSGFGTNYYIYLSIFLAYAYIFPNATFMLFFIIPVKAKYLAYIEWALYILAFIRGPWSHRFAIVFSLINFFLFFGPQVWSQLRGFINMVKRRSRYNNNWNNNNWR